MSKNDPIIYELRRPEPNFVVVVCRLYYVDTLKLKFIGTNDYKLQASLSEKVAVDGHGCNTALNFGVKAKENQDTVPTLYQSKMYCQF